MNILSTNYNDMNILSRNIHNYILLIIVNDCRGLLCINE